MVVIEGQHGFGEVSGAEGPEPPTRPIHAGMSEDWQRTRKLWQDALMTILGLHHVQLAMPQGGESDAEAFYEDLLGIQRVPKPPHLELRGGCWFESDAVRIHLGVEDGFVPARKAHPALLVDDLESLRHQLGEAGVAVVDDQPLPGFNRFYADDPFGNRLELLSPLDG